MYREKTRGGNTRLTGNPALTAYPVGAVYISTVNTAPNLLFGGTWAALAPGRVLVGIDATQTEFDAAEETGGSKTVTLTEGQLPSHTHGAGSYSGSSSGGHTHDVARRAAAGTVGGVSMGSGTQQTGQSTTSEGSHTHNVTGTSGATGNGEAVPNLPPYLVVYMWKRTA